MALAAGLLLAVLAVPSAASAVPAPAGSLLGALTPVAVQRAYNETGLLAEGYNGSGFVIATIDAYSGQAPPAELRSDYARFSSLYGLPGTGLEVLEYGLGATNTSDPLANAEWGIEDRIDIEWAHALAPGATILDVLTASGMTSLMSAVGYVVNHSLADIVSMSFAVPATNASWNDQAFGPVLESAAAKNITLLAASGDCGMYGGALRPTTEYPALSPWVTAVGGTQLRVNASGDRVGEWAWNGTGTAPCFNRGGSGGGFGPGTRPGWQTAVNGSLRGVPDVAADAYPDNDLVLNGSVYKYGGGTSLATPLWAGVVAVMDSYFNASVGFLNPRLYGIASDPAEYARSFYPVLGGFNGYNVTPGWNPVTGLGSPNVGGLALAWAHPDRSPVGSGRGTVLRIADGVALAPLGLVAGYAIAAAAARCVPSLRSLGRRLRSRLGER